MAKKPLLNLEELKKMAEGNSWKNTRGDTIRVNEARKDNIAEIQKNLWQNKEMMFMRERFQRKFGFDFCDRKEFPVHERGFNWQKVAKKLGFPSVDMAVREADSSSTFVQVLRAGIQSLVNSSYETVPTTFESWTSTVNSTRDTELYAPLHGVGFLSEVGKQELYAETRAAGLDIKLKNRKYGVMYAVEKELLEDDQTGQFAKQAGLLGEYAKLAIEAIVYFKLTGQGGTYSTLTVPATETDPSYEANYPFAQSSSPFRGGGFNRPASYGALTQANIQSGFIGLMQQLNLLGLKMNVDPSRLLISPFYRFDAAVLLNSSFYPSVPGISGATPSSSAGTPGGSFAINPIESIAALTVSRFMPDNNNSVGSSTGSKRWLLIDDHKPFFVCQIRQAAEVLQEAPNAGQSFDRDVIRFKLSLRANADWIDPRFAWQGSDGSA